MELLDRCADALRRVPVPVALLWLTALPSRLILIKFALVLIKAGHDAREYGDLLHRITNAYLCSWLLAVWGRQIFIRALVRSAIAGDAGKSAEAAGETRGQRLRELLQLPAAQLASAIYAGAAVELLFWLTLPTIVIPLVLAIAAVVAQASARPDARDLLSPIAETTRGMTSLWTLFKIGFVGLLALLLAVLNLNVFCGALVWLAGGIAGLDLPALAATLSFDNDLYSLLLLTGATLLIEPFWLGMIALHADAGRSEKSGEDLRRRFAALARREAP
jgi:hypothetical protein